MMQKNLRREKREYIGRILSENLTKVSCELCISPVYRRLAVAKFSKSTM